MSIAPARKKPHRVLLFAPMPPPWHGQAIMAGVLSGCGKEWADTEFHALDAKFADSLEKLRSFSPGKMFRLAGYLCKVGWTCLTRRIDVVILTPGFYRNTFLKDSLFIWLAWLLRRRTVAWFHMDYGAFDKNSLPGWFLRYMRFTLRRCSRYVVCTDRLRPTAPEFLPPEKISALQNGIPDPAAGHTAAPGTGEMLRVLYVSNMNESKGWMVLLEAAAAICRERGDVEFVFHGAPTGERPLEEMHARFRDTGGGERIRYAGFLSPEAKAEAFRSADLFAMPTFTEAFPLAVMEAMAFGLPVIASDVGGIPDMTGETAWLVPPRDAVALAGALRQALSDRKTLEARGRASRERYEANFTVTAFSKRWESYMAGLATSNGSQFP